MYTGPIICLVVLAAITAVLFARRQFPGQRGFKLPPGAYRVFVLSDNLKPISVLGPPSLPIIGNLRQLPKTGAHLKYQSSP